MGQCATKESLRHVALHTKKSLSHTKKSSRQVALHANDVDVALVSEKAGGVASASRCKPILASNQLDVLASITAKTSELQGYGIKIRTPKVALVGGQGAGKSSVLNALLLQVGSTARFPTGNGTCTRCPTVLTLKQGSAESVTIAGGGVSTTLPPQSTSEDVVQAIENAQARILVAEHGATYAEDPERKSSAHVRFSQTPVVITAVAPLVATEVILVDLPGLVAGLQSEAVEAIVRSHIEEENTLIIACGKSDNDAQTDAGLALAESPGVDPSGARTIRLHTFFRLARPELQADIRNAIAASADRGTSPHILDLEQRCGGQLVEAPFVVGVPSDVQGIAAFVRRCADRLGPLIRTSKASLQEQLSVAATAVAHRLDAIGRSPLGESELWDQYVTPIFRVLRKRAEAIVCQAAPRDGGVNVNTALQVFQADLSRWSGDHIDELDIQYWTICELEPLTFQGAGEMKSIVERMMGRWVVPFAQLIEAYRTVYQSALLQSPVIPHPQSASSTPASAGPTSVVGAIFAAIDTNHDGVISLDEMRAHLRERAAAAASLFERIDTNRDGVLSFDEMQRFVSDEGMDELLSAETGSAHSSSSSTAPIDTTVGTASVLDGFAVPQALKQLIVQRWNEIIESQIKLLTRRMVPASDAVRAEVTELEKMMNTPPPHDLESAVALSLGRSKDELKRTMLSWPPTAHELLKDLAARFGEVYDPAALGNESYSPPAIVLKVAETRAKIRQEAESWIGCVRNGRPTGRMLGFVTQVRDQIHHQHVTAFDDFVTRDQMRSEPTKTLVMQIFQAEWEKQQSERSRLMKVEQVLKEVQALVKQL